MGDLRVTVLTARLLLVFLADADRRWYGGDLARETGMFSGVLHPMLQRLLRAGWMVREDEVGDPRSLGRPVRHYYRLHPDRVVEVREAVDETRQRVLGWLTPPAAAGAL